MLPRFLLYFSLFNSAFAQLKLVDFAYTPFNKGPPNAGFMQVYLAGSSSSTPGETAWYSVCATTSDGTRKSLSYSICMKYGYTSGNVYEISQGNTQMPCADFTCSSDHSDLANCGINIDKQWREKRILYLVCYRSNGDPLGQAAPHSDRSWPSVDCDFEGGTACGWDRYAMDVYSGGMLYQYDATLGTAGGHVLAHSCQSQWSSWNSGNPPTVTEAVLTSPWLNQCLGYSRFCFTFSSLAPLIASRRPNMTISVLDSNNRELWSTLWQATEQAQWSVNHIGFAAMAPFRVRLRSVCSGEPPVLFLDDFLLTTGECPSSRNICYNYGRENTSRYGDRFCDCQSGWTVGKWCELTACGGAGHLKHFDSMNVIALVSVAAAVWVPYSSF